MVKKNCVRYFKPFPSGSFSIYPLGGVFWGMGAPKSVEQGASYSEGYIRYPNGSKGLKYPA